MSLLCGQRKLRFTSVTSYSDTLALRLQRYDSSWKITAVYVTHESVTLVALRHLHHLTAARYIERLRELR